MKITPASSINVRVFGHEVKELRKIENPIYIGRFYGQIQGLKITENKKSAEPQTCFIGEFRAENSEMTDEVFTSEKLYMFRAMEEKLQAAFETSKGEPVDFAYDITAFPSEASPTGYAYRAQSLMETKASNRLAEIASKLPARPTQHGDHVVHAEDHKSEPTATEPAATTATDKKKK